MCVYVSVSVCACALQLPCGNFGCDSEQPNEFLGSKIFFFPPSVTVLLMLKILSILPNLKHITRA